MHICVFMYMLICLFIHMLRIRKYMYVFMYMLVYIYVYVGFYIYKPFIVRLLLSDSHTFIHACIHVVYSKLRFAKNMHIYIYMMIRLCVCIYKRIYLMKKIVIYLYCVDVSIKKERKFSQHYKSTWTLIYICI